MTTNTTPLAVSISSISSREAAANTSAATATAAVVRQPVPNEATSGAMP